MQTINRCLFVHGCDSQLLSDNANHSSVCALNMDGICKNYSVNNDSRLAGVPLVFVEHLNIPPLSEPTRNVVSSLGLKVRLVTAISLSPLRAVSRSFLGRLSVNKMNLASISII